MTRAFIRGIFGVTNDNRRFHKCRQVLDKDIEYCLHNKYDMPFIAYVFGEDNYRQLVDLGISCVLVDRRPIVWDLDSQMMRHKLEIFKAGAEDFDEVLFLDWDVLPIKKLPEDFWDVISNKKPLQAILRQYKRTKAFWRNQDKNKIPCAAFVYIRGSEVTQGLIETWKQLKEPWSEEIVMAKYIDDFEGGWKGMDYYWNHYEPDYFVLEQRVTLAYPKDMRDSKDKIYHHFHRLGVEKGLCRIKDKIDLKEWELQNIRRHDI